MEKRYQLSPRKTAIAWTAGTTAERCFRTGGSGSKVRRQAIAKWRLLELLQERLLSDLLNRNGTGEKLDKLTLQIAEKKIDPYSAIEEILL